ncbi:MAG: hypothetical protein WCE81_12025, partial [Halobacteriota archaeon]
MKSFVTEKFLTKLKIAINIKMVMLKLNTSYLLKWGCIMLLNYNYYKCSYSEVQNGIPLHLRITITSGTIVRRRCCGTSASSGRALISPYLIPSHDVKTVY